MMSLTPMTRYYIRRLLAKRAESLGLTVSGAESDSQAFADQLARLESLAATKLAEIDLIVRMHQTLSRNGQTYNSYLANLEQKLFALMGLGGQPREELTDITLPQLEETKGAAAKVLTLAEVLEHFNKIGDIAQKYLGKMIVANYWRGTRPYSSWFADFTVTNDGRVVCQSYQSSRDVFLSEEQLEHLQGWLEAFIRQCQRVLPQFTKQLQKAGVPETVLA
ncbi:MULTISPECIES: hypothetical protein [unclassified Thermosynechococcus]|uniref:hypothetical protein n=3 Tax=Thermosynechococcus TaxID=146785 RepID=UPI002856E81C|nr:MULTISPECIES: hypothetical protein [unclassified Thermosynechococcus]MDR7922800.1 hypothetical protein [Thermosynechococcus sp. HY213]WNC21683.1 hypothetical protein RHG98_09820 [Thermosynechococcus sp. PP22]WNC31922.1 hypothetical protein RHH81_09785 [Thermosynechococcus sp. PKX95]WNC34449.1 hypothetical protein RHH79_09780 [Thermosynechococcus sp. PKX91]WNC36969.1 hypothetical protein RHI11_09775 [Thermosynechococcus sp. WL11]